MRQDVVIRAPARYLAKGLDFFAVFLRLVVLLAILMQAMMTFDGLADCRPMAAGPFLQLFDQTTVRLLAMLSLSVTLWAARPS